MSTVAEQHRIVIPGEVTIFKRSNVYWIALDVHYPLGCADGDGKISFQDLDVSLSRVAICCPSNR